MLDKAVTFVVTIRLGWPPKVGHPRLLANLLIISGDGDELKLNFLLKHPNPFSIVK